MAYLHKRQSKGITYWSIRESFREKGKKSPSTRVLINIGSDKNLSSFVCSLLDDKKSATETYVIRTRRHGAAMALFKVARELNIINILGRTFGVRERNDVSRGISILLAAIHRAMEPGSKRAFSDWFRMTSLPEFLNIDPSVMTSQHFWSQMDGISNDELEAAEDAISEAALHLIPHDTERINLDYSNYYTFISSANNACPIAKRGKNKQGRRDLRQVSLAIVTTSDLRIPLISHLYEGNINDIQAFREYMDVLKKRISPECLANTTFVFDGGGNTKKNLQLIEGHYICKFSLSCAKELYDIPINKYKEVRIDEKTVSAFRLSYNIWGETRDCVLMYSEDLFNGQIAELNKTQERISECINELNGKLTNPKSRVNKDKDAVLSRISSIMSGKKYVSQFISFEYECEGVKITASKKSRKANEEGDKELDKTTIVTKVIMIVDQKKRSAVIKKYFGKQLLITDQTEWTTEKIIGAYRDQSCVEHIFRSTKSDHGSIQPVFHWTEQKLRVHVFICLLSQVLIRLLQYHVNCGGLKMSKEYILDRLNEIDEAWLATSAEASGEKIGIKKQITNLEGDAGLIWDVVENIPPTEVKKI